MNAVHRPGTDEHPEPVVFSQMLRGGGGSTFPPSNSHTPMVTPRPPAAATPRSHTVTPRPLQAEEAQAPASAAPSPATSAAPAPAAPAASGRLKSAIRSKSASRATSAGRLTRADEVAAEKAKSRGAAVSPTRPAAAHTQNSHTRGFSFAGPQYHRATLSGLPSVGVLASPTAAGASHTRAAHVPDTVSSAPISAPPVAAASPATPDIAGTVDRKSFLKLQRTVDSLTRQLQLLQRQSLTAIPMSPASSIKRAQGAWRASNAPPEAHLASTLIGAAWRGYSTRRRLRSLKDEDRLRKLEEAVQYGAQMREAQEQAARFLWEEVKQLRVAQANSDARLAELQARCDREVQRSQQLAEQLHLIARTPATLKLSQMTHPTPPAQPNALTALQQLASTPQPYTPAQTYPHSYQSPEQPSFPPPRPTVSVPLTPAASSAGTPAFDANAFLRGYSEGDEEGNETARGTPNKPTSTSLPSSTPRTASSLSSSAPLSVTTHDPGCSQVVATLESTPLQFSKLLVDVLAGRDLTFGDGNSSEPLRPYAVVTCQSSRGETEVEEDTSEPEWITNFVLDVDHDAAFSASRGPPGSDLTASHVAVTILSKRRDASDTSPTDELLGSVLIPLADLHDQMPVSAWYPLHARVKDVRSPKGGPVKPRGGMVQLALHWLHSLTDLAQATHSRAAPDLQHLFASVDVSQLLLQVQSADLHGAWPDGGNASQHAAWLSPCVTVAFQGSSARTEEGGAPSSHSGGVDDASASHTHPHYPSRTLSFDVDSTGDLHLHLSVHRSLRAAPADSEQLLAVGRCAVSAFADQRTRTLTVTLQHPFTGADIGSVRLALLWLHNLPSLMEQMQQSRKRTAAAAHA